MPRTEPADQPRPSAAQIATFKAAHSIGTYVFAETVVVTYRGHTLTFRDSRAYALEPAIIAWLSASGINPTAQ